MTNDEGNTGSVGTYISLFLSDRETATSIGSKLLEMLVVGMFVDKFGSYDRMPFTSESSLIRLPIDCNIMSVVSPIISRAKIDGMGTTSVFDGDGNGKESK